MKKWAALLLCAGCCLHQVDKCPEAPIEIPENFHHAKLGEALKRPWWEEFNDSDLNGVIAETLENNLTLAQGWDRLEQARAGVKTAHSASRLKFDIFLIGKQEKQAASLQAGARRDNRTFLFSNQLAYEVDLWGKIDSSVQAACLDFEWAASDVQAMALMLSGSAVTAWFTLLEQVALLDLLKHQIEVNKTQLSLIELRFSLGLSSALDVYQQRLQLAATESEVPGIESLKGSTEHVLSTLMGKAPQYVDIKLVDSYQKLPPFPDIGSPADLLFKRPDLKAAYQALVAADYRIAEAARDMLPHLDLNLGYDFRATSLHSIFEHQVLTLAANMLTPVLDGGRRSAEVDRRQGVWCEKLHMFGQTFLTALKEVEDALLQEEQQLNLLQLLEGQLEIAERNLSESQRRYRNGLNDYLTVIAAIQSLQNLERRLITERKELFVIRSNLYLALGGV